MGATDEVFCIGQRHPGVLTAYCIARGANCSNVANLNGSWSHVGAFAVPPNSTGRPWCVGHHRTASGESEFTASPHSHCDGVSGFEHALSFREVALADLTEDT